MLENETVNIDVMLMKYSFDLLEVKQSIETAFSIGTIKLANKY